MIQAPQFCIFGAGAVGSLLAARLGQAGMAPVIVARGERLRQLRQTGLILEDRNGQSKIEGVIASAIDEVAKPSVLFIALKSYAIEAALPQLLRLIGPRTKIIPLVNGIPWWYFQPEFNRSVEAVDPRGALLSSFAARQIVGSVVLVNSSLGKDGLVAVTGPEHLTLGWINGSPSDDLEEVASALRKSDIGVKLTRQIRSDIWSKLALNLSSNPLSVIMDSPLSDQLTNKINFPKLITVIVKLHKI